MPENYVEKMREDLEGEKVRLEEKKKVKKAQRDEKVKKIISEMYSKEMTEKVP